MPFQSFFSERPTIHGLIYLSEKNKIYKTLHQKIAWILFITISCVLCIWMSFNLAAKYNNTHTITTIVSNTYHVSKVPFPYVAVCNNNKVSKEKFQFFKSILLNYSFNEYDIDNFGKSLSSLTTFSTFEYIHTNLSTSYKKMFEVLESHNYTVDRLMKELQKNCTSFVFVCFLQARIVNCSDYFEMIKTGDGYCCAFNYHGVKYFLDNDTSNFTVDKEDPIHLIGYQLFGGLSFVINLDKDDYLAPSRPYYGALVLVGDANDFPDTTVKSAILQPSDRKILEVTPSVVEITSDVARLSDNVRNCWLDNEVITTDGFYSFQSCMTKCRALAIFKTCGCIPYFYPKIGLDLRRKCTLADNKCLRENKGYFFSVSTEKFIGVNCNCKFECSNQFYKIFPVHGKIKHSSYLNFFISRSNGRINDIASVSVFFPKIACYKYRTDVLWTWNDALSLYGGVCNLFIGGSILSILEITIYLIIRRYKIKIPFKKNHKLEYTN